MAQFLLLLPLPPPPPGITPLPGGPAGVAGAADDAEDTPYTAAILGTDNKPYFDDVSPRNVTTVVDDMAVLKCRVKHKGNRTVSVSGRSLRSSIIAAAGPPTGRF